MIKLLAKIFSLVFVFFAVLSSNGKPDFSGESQTSVAKEVQRQHVMKRANKYIDTAKISGTTISFQSDNAAEITVDVSNFVFYTVNQSKAIGYKGISADCLENVTNTDYIPIKLIFVPTTNGFQFSAFFLNRKDSKINSFSTLLDNNEFEMLHLNIKPLTEKAEDDLLRQEMLVFEYPQAPNTSSIRRTANPQQDPYNDVQGDLADQCEEMTSSRDVFDEYNPTDNIYDDNSFITGSNITKFIPEAFFTNTGDYGYLGKEYGFVVKTIPYGATLAGVEKHMSFVTLFSVYITLPGNLDRAQREIVIKIVPELFSIFRHDIREDDYYWKYNWFSPSVDELIYHYSDAPYASLSNIRFGVSLQNTNEPNIGDDDYVSEEDNGDFIIQTRYNYSGYDIKEEKTDYNFLINDAKIILTYLPFSKAVMKVLNGIDDAITLLVDFLRLLASGSSILEYVQKTGNNEANIFTYPQSALEQRQVYGNLLKTVLVGPNDDSNSTQPVVFRDFNNYAQANILTNYGNNNLPSNETNLNFAIAFDINDQSSSPIFGVTGDLNKIATFAGTNSTSTYQSTQREISSDEQFKKNYKSGETVRVIYSSSKSQRQAISYSVDEDSTLKIYEGKQLIEEDELKPTSKILENILFNATDYYFEISGFENDGSISISVVDSSIVMMDNEESRIDIYMTEHKKDFAVCIKRIDLPYATQGVMTRRFTVTNDDSTMLYIYTLDGEFYSSGNSTTTPSVFKGKILSNDLVAMFYMTVETSRINYEVNISIRSALYEEIPWIGDDFTIIDRPGIIKP